MTKGAMAPQLWLAIRKEGQMSQDFEALQLAGPSRLLIFRPGQATLAWYLALHSSGQTGGARHQGPVRKWRRH